MADSATIWLDPQQADSDVKSTFQSQPKVTALADGGFLVTWTSEIAGLTKIQGRLYDYLGHAVSDELILDGTPDSGNQIYGYDVAALADGGFAVAYYDNDNGLTVRAARFDAAGLLVHDVLVGDDPQNVTLAPSIAPLSGGSYQVAWNIVDGHASGGIATSDVDADGVAGAPADLAVEAPTQYLSDSAALSDGSIVTVFSETLGSGHADDIRVIIRTVGGDPVKDFYAAAGPNSESGAIVTALKTGGFAVAWTDPQGDSDNSYGVLIAIYDNSGGLVKAPFHPYADPAAGTQYDRALIPLADGGFVAVWTDHGDKTYRARRFDHDGNTVGSQITVQGPTDATIAPAVGTLLADGRIALTWYNPEFDPNDPNTEIDSDVFVAILDPRGAVIDGTAGADKIAARLEGGTVRGLGGDDLITGRNGADFIDGGTGGDTMIGGGGNDTYVVDSAGDVVDERGGSGVDTVISSLSFSLAYPAHVLGAVEKLVLIGNARIGVGNDAGNTLVGNAVANVLDGKSGSDRLIGGRGKDAFLFDTALNGRTNVDHIADLHHGVDVIRLDDDIFRTVGRRIEAGEFHLGVNAGDAGDRLIYDRAHGRLYYDADGTGAKAKVLFAILDNHALLGATDFAVVA